MTTTPTPDGTHEGRLSLQDLAETMLRHRLNTIDAHRNPTKAIIKRDITVNPPLRDHKKELAEVIADYLGVAMLAWRTVEVREPLVFTAWGPMTTLGHFEQLTDLLITQAMAEAETITDPSGARRRKYVAAFTRYMSTRLHLNRIITAQSFSTEQLRAVRASHDACFNALSTAHPDAIFDTPESGFAALVFYGPIGMAHLLATATRKTETAKTELDRRAGTGEIS